MRWLALAGGLLQVVGVCLAARQLVLARRQLREALGDPEMPMQMRHLPLLKGAIMSLEGWRLGVWSLALIVIGIGCTTAAAVR